jgi:hypothetical protein
LGVRAIVLDQAAYTVATLTVMATTKKRTTKPLSPETRALRAELRAAKAKGESLTRVLYKAMSPDEKRAFVQRHAK